VHPARGQCHIRWGRLEGGNPGGSILLSLFQKSVPLGHHRGAEIRHRVLLPKLLLTLTLQLTLEHQVEAGVFLDLIGFSLNQTHHRVLLGA
jgi:hypothetical protein